MGKECRLSYHNSPLEDEAHSPTSAAQLGKVRQ
jgi:hypothetical protein